MSLWKFGSFEEEVDFADADFLDKLDDAKKTLDKMLQKVPKTGKQEMSSVRSVPAFMHFLIHSFGMAQGMLFLKEKTACLCA